MNDKVSKKIKSGLTQLDEVLQGLNLGDNVVWKVDNLEDYMFFAEPFANQAIKEGYSCVYMRFAPHEPILKEREGLEIVKVDPRPGFDYFSGEVHRIIKERGREAFYIFDSLSSLVVEWATDELLANFFQVTCPFLFELDTVAYFALTRGQHSFKAAARIRNTTQVLINLYRVKDEKYIHPLKVWNRYSTQMFLPHVVSETVWSPIFSSGDAAEVISIASKKPLTLTTHFIAPWESVHKKLTQYRETGKLIPEPSSEIDTLKKEFSRMIMGSHPEFNKLIDNYFTVNDLLNIRDRLIGSGRIGGKAAGMLLARRILSKANGKIDFPEVMEGHDSFYIGSDVFFTFLVNNDLFRLRLDLSGKSEFSYEEFKEVEQRFLDGKFPQEILEQFQNMLDYFGQAPIIVRSSSLLEDSFGNAFAGKYRSEFCANQGNPQERLEAFLRAVKLVYASALNPDALSYRRRRGLGESDEQMAILVQRVCGMHFKELFFPALAGVALSRNLYVWTDRIDPKKGVIRLVYGLGTRAVDRVGGDYPRMIPVSHPKLRPEVGTKIARYSQHELDLINLKLNQFVTQPVEEVFKKSGYPHLHLLVSTFKDGDIFDPISSHIDAPSNELILTFNNLISRTDFVNILGEMVAELETVYDHPVEIEFTACVGENRNVKVNLLQCRPMSIPGISSPIIFPTDVPKEKILFRSNRFIAGGVVDKILYIIYIDPKHYSVIKTMERKKSLARIVGKLNASLRSANEKILMMGPGRWGSSNINLGVNVSYADINNAKVLVEIAREEAGHVPEVSYGTHFFLDLVEADIIYLPVYPDDEKTEFNEIFFKDSPNTLKEIVPDAEGFENEIKVIDVSRAAKGVYAKVVADPDTQRAICFLED